MSSIIPLLLISPLLAGVAYCDLRFMRIPNVLSLLMVAVFAASAILLPPSDIQMRIAVAGTVFGLGFIGFCFRLLGGGDVKILAALMLFVPSQDLALFGYLFSASMLIGVLAILTLRRLPLAADHHWKSLSGSTKFPMGISIALSGILLPLSLLAPNGF